MSRSKHAVELCALLVDETYGELSSRIFTILLRRGRLQIYQLIAHTRLTKRQVQHGLAVLIQQNLIYHCFDKAEERTYYEANHDAAYALVRTGKIVELVESRFGGLAKDVVQNLLLLGHTKVSDLADAYATTNKSHINGHDTEHTRTNGVNGVNGKHKAQITSAGQLDYILSQLLQSGLVQPVIERMFLSPTDTYNLVEKVILQENFGGQTKGTRQKEQLKAKVRDQIKSWRDEARNWKPSGGIKRPGDVVNGANGQGKKRRLSRSEASNNSSHTFYGEGTQLDRDLVVRVNYEKCTVALRNQQLVQLANSRIGETTSQIYSELLRLLEESIPRCRLDPDIDDLDDLPDSATVTTTELSIALSKSIKVSRGIGDPSHGDGNNNKHRNSSKGKNKANLDDAALEGEASSDENESDEDVHMHGNGNIPEVDEDSAGDRDDPFEEDPRPAKRAKVTFEDKAPQPKADKSDDPEMRLYHIKMHLRLLAADSFKFIRKCGKGGSNEWTVDFEPLVARLRESEIDTILLENFGQGGHRLVRMLRNLGKLEEKALPNLALMKQKDIRTKMAEMQMAGMVDIQEVPRDASRTTQRTIFLWYFDLERVSCIILESVYKAMSRCLQRLEVEKRRANGILSMAERTDVRETSEAEVLTREQLGMLEEIRNKEYKLLGQIGRLDELVGVFRDY